jgi:hypothetical protein
MVASIIYLLCALTGLLCSGLLFRAYLRTGAVLLFWSSICFLGLTIDNSILLLVDVLIYPQTDLFWIRQLGTLTGLTLLIYSMIWHTK